MAGVQFSFEVLAVSGHGEAENPEYKRDEHIPFGGRYEGTEGFLKYLGEIFAAIEMEALEMDEWVADARTVAVRGEDKGLVRSNGRKYRMRFVHWLTFDDTGRIAFMREFNDTAALAEAFDR